MVYFRYDASSSAITSHADQVLGRVLFKVFFRVGKSVGKVFRLIYKQKYVLYFCHHVRQ